MGDGGESGNAFLSHEQGLRAIDPLNGFACRIRGLRRSYSGALHVRGHVGATQAANSRNVHEEARQLPSRLAVLVQEIRRVLSAG